MTQDARSTIKVPPTTLTRLREYAARLTVETGGVWYTIPDAIDHLLDIGEKAKPEPEKKARRR